MSDRRSHHRAPFRAQVQVLHDGVVHDCSCLDVSEAGMRLAACLPCLPDCSTVTLLFSVPAVSDPGPVSLDGAVAWRKPDSTGVRFVDARPEARARLREYALHHASDHAQLHA